MTKKNKQTIFLIACEFWSSKGKTQKDMKDLFSTTEGMTTFLKPAVKIYKGLDLKFN